MEDLTREELQDLMESYNNYVMNFREDHDIYDEPISIYEYYDNEYQEPIPTLKGVGVKDTEKGIKVILMSIEEEILGTYEVETNMSGYNDIDLCKICYSFTSR